MRNPSHRSFLYGTVALAMMAVPAQAEPGSSDRLLDLERIIEQQQQMIKNQAEAFETLMLRIETVEGRTQANSEAVTKNQQAVTAATRSVRRIDSAATPPKMMTSGNPHVKLSVSGWVNHIVKWADNGTNDRVMVNDNINLPTRIRWLGRVKVDEKLSLGTTFEMGFNPNASNGQSIIDNTSTAPGFTMRKNELFIAHKGFGKITVGHGDPAANSVQHSDLTGTIAQMLPNGAAFDGGGMEFRNEAAGTTVTTVGSVFNDFDHVSRRNMARYDTPKFKGFSLGTSFIDHAGAGWDVAARYRGKIGDFNIKGGLGYTNGRATSLASGANYVSGTVSVKHSSGISGIIGAGLRDLRQPAAGREDPTSFYAKLAYGFKMNSYGTTTVAVDWQRVDDLQQDNDEADMFRFGLNQKIKKGAAEVYLTVSHFDLDRPGTPTSDIWAVGVGSRILF